MVTECKGDQDSKRGAPASVGETEIWGVRNTGLQGAGKKTHLTELLRGFETSLSIFLTSFSLIVVWVFVGSRVVWQRNSPWLSASDGA